MSLYDPQLATTLAGIIEPHGTPIDAAVCRFQVSPQNQAGRQLSLRELLGAFDRKIRLHVLLSNSHAQPGNFQQCELPSAGSFSRWPPTQHAAILIGALARIDVDRKRVVLLENPVKLPNI